jgi:hypothetical protein
MAAIGGGQINSNGMAGVKQGCWLSASTMIG